MWKLLFLAKKWITAKLLRKALKIMKRIGRVLSGIYILFSIKNPQFSVLILITILNEIYENKSISYINGRQQSIIINGIESSLLELLFGVPQGSVLGPILFIIYTSPLGNILRKLFKKYNRPPP